MLRSITPGQGPGTCHGDVNLPQAAQLRSKREVFTLHRAGARAGVWPGPVITSHVHVHCTIASSMTRLCKTQG